MQTHDNIKMVRRMAGIRETEFMFDDVNGSFVLENTHDANPHEFINAEEKLQNLPMTSLHL